MTKSLVGIYFCPRHRTLIMDIIIICALSRKKLTPDCKPSLLVPACCRVSTNKQSGRAQLRLMSDVQSYIRWHDPDWAGVSQRPSHWPSHAPLATLLWQHQASTSGLQSPRVWPAVVTAPGDAGRKLGEWILVLSSLFGLAGAWWLWMFWPVQYPATSSSTGAQTRWCVWRVASSSLDTPWQEQVQNKLVSGPGWVGRHLTRHEHFRFKRKRFIWVRFNISDSAITAYLSSTPLCLCLGGLNRDWPTPNMRQAETKYNDGHAVYYFCTLTLLASRTLFE